MWDTGWGKEGPALGMSAILSWANWIKKEVQVDISDDKGGVTARGLRRQFTRPVLSVSPSQALVSRRGILSVRLQW